MPQIPSSSELLKCEDLSSCFQSLYNLGFSIFLALAFLSFIYGAFQYLLSGAGVFQKEEGKKKMINSLIALIVILIVPVILNMINPNIFQAKLQIPKIIRITLPTSDVLLSIGKSEVDLTDDQINSRIEHPYISSGVDPQKDPCSYRISTCDVRRSSFPKLSNITFANNNDGTEYINPQLDGMLLKFNEKLKEKNIGIMITDGYSPNDHRSYCHSISGTCIDVVAFNNNGKIVNPNHQSWLEVKEIAKQVGFGVLDERFKAGSQYWTGAHLHLDARSF